ncbi:MAG: MmcQ/YjbR family DNA-binding protein [Clostridia bacterium]|nr:MmcQ/YjbR family DNA-binding protein [Clostridia bacterium]
MNYEWFDEYCISKKGTIKDLKVEWNNATRYMVGNKIYAMVSFDNMKRPIINLKVDPIYAEMAREKYTDVIPGYHMNKKHWNTVFINGNLPDDELRFMVDMAYRLVFESLTKKMQKEIGDN